MTTKARHLPWQGKEQTPGPEQAVYEPGLKAELRDCLEAMRQNEMLFNLECEPELIEQRIYEREALHSRYRYLLRRARAVGLRGIL